MNRISKWFKFKKKKISDWFKFDVKCTNNPVSLLLYRIGIKNQITVKTKTLGNFHIGKDNVNKIPLVNTILQSQKQVLDGKIEENKQKELIKFLNDLCENKDVIDCLDIKFLNKSGITILKEMFFDDSNIPFSTDIKNKTVIDIGGNIADTALMFAKEGAEVYAFEPVPPIYEHALENIDLNPDLKNNIHFYNKAVSDKNGTIKISFLKGFESGSSAYFHIGTLYDVETISLNDIINKLKENNIKPDLLKCDCEGSEYDIIPNADLSDFEELIIEHHQLMTGIDYHVLIDAIEKQGFKVDKISKVPGLDFTIDQAGIICASKK